MESLNPLQYFGGMRRLFLALILICIAVAHNAAAAAPAKKMHLPALDSQLTIDVRSSTVAEPAFKCCMKEHLRKSAVNSPCGIDASSIPPQLDINFSGASDSHEALERCLSPTDRPAAPFKPPIA